MFSFIIKQKLQSLLLSMDEEKENIAKIYRFIQEQQLFKNPEKSLSTLKLIASTVYSNPKLFYDAVELLKLFKNIKIKEKFLNEKNSNNEVIKRSILVYILLNLSGHLKMNEIRSAYKSKYFYLIDPGGRFPNKSKYKLFDYQLICNIKRKERKMLRNRMHSTHPLACAILNDDISFVQKFITNNNYDINDEIPFSHFEFYNILEHANALQYSAFYGSINCFKFLFRITNNINFEKLLEFAFAGGNYDIIHIIENESHDENIKSNQNLLYLAILHMNNNLIEYILDSYNVIVDNESYNKCIYSSNYEVMMILNEYMKKENENDKSSPIEISASEGYLDFFKYMIIMNFIEKNELQNESYNLLQIAIKNNQETIINYIIKNHYFIEQEETI